MFIPKTCFYVFKQDYNITTCPSCSLGLASIVLCFFSFFLIFIYLFLNSGSTLNSQYHTKCDGLSLAIDLDVSFLHVEMDAKLIVDLLSKGNNAALISPWNYFFIARSVEEIQPTQAEPCFS